MRSGCATEPFNAEYIRRLADGDSEAECQFMAFFDELLTLKLRARLRSQHAVDDVRQETYARVFAVLRGKGKISRPERFGAFVHSVCNNVLLEFYRTDGRTRQFPDDHVEPAVSGSDVEFNLVSRERKARVRELVEKLPPRDRELLRLLFYEERNKDEVCRLLNVDREYLRVLVHRATARLREKCLDSFFLH
jgi:RNA polymerase sigma-70 factor (ECF subfamily)